MYTSYSAPTELIGKVIKMRVNENIICYVYSKNSFTGKYIFEGKCKGFGTPYAIQYTSPVRDTAYGYALPQADTNGVYLPDSAKGTWVEMINESSGKTEVQLYQDNLTITQSKKPRRLCDESSLPADY